MRQCRVLHRAQQGSVLLYMTAATQMQGARLTAGHRRRSFFFTTFETLTIFLSALKALQAGPSHDSLACSQRVSVDGFVCASRSLAACCSGCFFIFLLALRARFFAVAVFLLALRARFFMPRFFKARYWWETFVETKVLPPSPLSKELWVLVRS